ncbi:MAG: MerR family transcriptional regulator [Alphaproteobacteria bacterium]|nr:MerR family transcriptional regulator [Alphaproteobacteria bacterium]
MATTKEGSEGRSPVRKSPDAFRTISEVSEELNVPQHVLRFWESKFTQIRPLKRGGRRRYYRPEDVQLLRGIRRLLYDDGFTIKGVQKVLRERGVRVVAEGLDAVEAKLPGNGAAEHAAADVQASAPIHNDDIEQLLDELAAIRNLLKS